MMDHKTWTKRGNRKENPIRGLEAYPRKGSEHHGPHRNRVTPRELAAQGSQRLEFKGWPEVTGVSHKQGYQVSTPGLTSSEAVEGS